MVVGYFRSSVSGSFGSAYTLSHRLGIPAFVREWRKLIFVHPNDVDKYADRDNEKNDSG